METTSLPQGSEITGNVLFYEKPEPLSRDTHGKLGLRTVDKPFGFAANTNVVPLTVTEFAPAAIAYPIIFAGEGYQPLAVMGVSQGTNLFISADGSVEPDAYLPAYIRRYPFVLAGDGGEVKDAAGVVVSAEIIAQAKSEKVIVFKKRRRHNYRRRNGHRQQMTLLRILAVGGADKKPAAKKAAAPKKKRAPNAADAHAAGLCAGRAPRWAIRQTSASRE